MKTTLAPVNILSSKKGQFVELPYTEYFHNTDKTSYKSWSLKNTTQHWDGDSWLFRDLVFSLFSTGKSCLCGNLSAKNNLVTMNWRVVLLDKDKIEIQEIKFAPIVFTNIKSGKGRKIKFEKRIRNINIDVLYRVTTIRIFPD